MVDLRSPVVDAVQPAHLGLTGHGGALPVAGLERRDLWDGQAAHSRRQPSPIDRSVHHKMPVTVDIQLRAVRCHADAESRAEPCGEYLHRSFRREQDDARFVLADGGFQQGETDVGMAVRKAAVIAEVGDLRTLKPERRHNRLQGVT